MGDDAVPYPPSGECPDCCDSLPATLHARLVLVGNAEGPFEGVINQDLVDKCRYAGYIWDAEMHWVGFACSYCTGGVNVVHLGCYDRPFCPGKTAIFAHWGCFPPAAGESPLGDINFSIT